jgi:hypothetical protein
MPSNLRSYIRLYVTTATKCMPSCNEHRDRDRWEEQYDNGFQTDGKEAPARNRQAAPAFWNI